MSNTDKLAAAKAHIAHSRKQTNRTPDSLALDLLHEVVSDLVSKSAANAPAPRSKSAKPKA